MTTVGLTQIAAVAAAECERQQVGIDALARLLTAYDAARRIAEDWSRPGLADVITVGRLIDPANTAWRRTPVTFVSGGSATDHRMVAGAMERWRDNFADTPRPIGELADEIVRAFLHIHPFADGNGRTAWVLRVWLLDQWDDPEPLPHYFG